MPYGTRNTGKNAVKKTEFFSRSAVGLGAQCPSPPNATTMANPIVGGYAAGYDNSEVHYKSYLRDPLVFWTEKNGSVESIAQSLKYSTTTGYYLTGYTKIWAGDWFDRVMADAFRWKTDKLLYR